MANDDLPMLDFSSVRNWNLSSLIEKYPSGMGSVLHRMLQQVTPATLSLCSQRRSAIYIMINAGLDVDAQDECGNTALHLILTSFNGDIETAEPLLQAGANLHLSNKENKTVLNTVNQLAGLPGNVTQVFNKYSPGLWKAVETDDLLSVRKLINLWCRVDIQRNGQTLREKALSIGTEHIIRLIKEIEPSMKLAHAVLAEDYNKAKEILNSSAELSVNLEFKNLGDMGATPLFYAILQNDVSMVQLLCKHGARPDAIITLEDEDIPVLFAALHKDTDPEMIQYLVSPRHSSPLPLTTLHYRGQHVLLHCIKNRTSVAVVRHILQQGYSELVYMRDEHNQCARDLASKQGKMDYVAAIDEAVHDWYLDVDDKHRKAMALMGYPHLRQAVKDGVPAYEVLQSMETSSPQAQFDSQLQLYQDQIERFVSAVVAGNLEQVKSLVHFHSDGEVCFVPCLANCRAREDGQPPLHKALLRGHLHVLEFLAQSITGTLGIKLDEVRDPSMRTALHYAYGTPHYKHVVSLLLDYGSSEFTMDKDSRSPLVFKSFCGHPDMEKLLAWHRDQLYDKPEPEPWSKRVPPIIASLQSLKAKGDTRAKELLLGRVATVSSPPTPQSSSWFSICTLL